MFKNLFNVSMAFAFFLLGPEVLAKSLPMKKVQTVETVWVPMDPGEIEVPEEGIEAVEIEENQQGAVPLFQKPTVSKVVPVQEKAQVQDLPKIFVQEPKGQSIDQRPVIQVIYQTGESEPQIVSTQEEEKKSKPVEIKKEEPLPPPEKGDTYNFYFQS